MRSFICSSTGQGVVERARKGGRARRGGGGEHLGGPTAAFEQERGRALHVPLPGQALCLGDLRLHGRRSALGQRLVDVRAGDRAGQRPQIGVADVTAVLCCLVFVHQVRELPQVV